MASQEIIKKVQEKAQSDFFEQRIMKLSHTIFPKEDYHPSFKETLQNLLKFNNFRQMNVNKETWKNMCTFYREFFMPEMEVCFEILLRATPKELINIENKSDEEILNEYNNIALPKIMGIINPMKTVFDKIDNSISTPIANKINSDAKISLKLPIGTDIKFVQRPTFN